MAHHGDDISVLRIHRDNRPVLISQGLFCDLLDIQIQSKKDIIPAQRLVHLQNPDLMTERIDFDSLLAGGSPDNRVKGLLDSVLADDSSPLDVLIISRLKLGLSDFTDISEEMRRIGSIDGISLKFGLNLYPRQIESVPFNQRHLPHRQVILHLDREEGVLFLEGHPPQHLLLVHPDEVRKVRKNRRLIGHITQNNIEIEARNVIDEEGPVSVIDQTAGRSGFDDANAIVLRQLEVEFPVDAL